MKNRNLNNKDDWATPDYILDQLVEEFGSMFDPCPLHHNTDDWDGLQIEWSNVNFVNPPYSRKLKDSFVKKAIEEQRKGKTSVMLLPVSTSTILFHEHIKPNATEIRFLKGRVKFIGVNTKGKKVKNSVGMHDSMIVVFGEKKINHADMIISKINRATNIDGCFWADSEKCKSIIKSQFCVLRQQ